MMADEHTRDEIDADDLTTPAHRDEPASGSMVGRTMSHYRILAKLGGGGMGIVYKAEDTKLHRTVALKFLACDAIGSGEARDRFLREARLAASLSHPGICTIHEVGEIDSSSEDDPLPSRDPIS
jgi:serine/threonine protein kinase